MSLEDKVNGTKDQAAGKVKEVAGKVTGDEKTEAEGKAQGLMGDAKKAFGDVKEKAADVFDDVKEKTDDVVDDVKKKFSK